MIAPGQRAPLVRLTDTRGTPADVGAPGGPALVVFLPAAFTPVCSGELAGLRRVLPRVREAGAEVLAVACDSMFALRTWAEQEGLGEEPGLRVLSDFWPHGAASRAYEAFDAAAGTSTRASYLLDGDAVVRWSTRTAPGVARDLDEHADAVERLLVHGTGER